MTRTTSRRLLGSAAVLALFAAGAAQADTLNVYNWSDYIGEETIANFEAETGIRVNYDVYDSNSVVEARLLAGASGYDIVVPTAVPYLERQIQAGVYQPLNRDLIPNWDNLDPALMAVIAGGADPDNAHSAIYLWGTNGLGYNVEAIAERMPDAPVTSYDMLFDPEVVANFADCGIAVLDDASEVLPVLLNYLGYPPYAKGVSEAEALEQLAAAEERMMAIRPHIRYFHSSQYINDLANGEICLAYGWSGDVFQARDRADETDQAFTIDYVIPDEGTILWFDMLAIPTDAPNPDNAHAFINYLLQPEVMAGVTDYVVYANAVPASLDFVDPDIVADPGVFPPDAVKERLFSAQGVDPAYERARTRSWTRIRTGQ